MGGSPGGLENAAVFGALAAAAEGDAATAGLALAAAAYLGLHPLLLSVRLRRLSPTPLSDASCPRPAFEEHVCNRVLGLVIFSCGHAWCMWH